MKMEDDGFFVPVLKNNKGNWRFCPSLICCAFALVCFAQTVFGAGAGITTTITDADGDIATVQLSGSGTMTVSLVNPSNGPIDHIALFNTDSSSSLTIKVKKSASGDGMINVNAISGDGSLKTLSAKSVNIVGSGINLGGVVGALTIGNLGNSTLALQGNGVPAGGVVLGSFSGGVVSGSQIQIGGSAGKFSAVQMLNSQFWAGYTPGVSTNPMAGGTFANGYQIKSVSLKGTKGSTASAFVNSTIAAQSIGSVALTSADTSNNGIPFGILTDTGIKSVSIKQPKFKWNLKGHNTQTLNDFQVRRLAEVIIASHTRVLTGADLSGLVISNSVYAFSASAPSLQGVQAGDVLVSSAGGGFLVDVLSVTSDGGSLALQTSPGNLTDAIQKGSFDQTIPFVPTAPLYLAPGVTVTTKNVDKVRLARESASTVNPQASLGQLTVGYTFDNFELAPNVDLTGSVDITVTPNISAQIASFDLQSFSVSVDADMTASVDVFVGASLSANQKVLVVTQPGAPVIIPTGFLPIVVVPTLNLYAGVEANADAGVDFNATMNGSYTAGAAWQKNAGWQNQGASSLQYTTTLANPTMGGSVRCYLRPEIVLAIYTVSGPDIYGEGGFTLAGSVNSAKHQFCWSLTGDLDAGVGFDLLTIGSVDLSYQAQVLSYDHQFAGTCYSTSSGSAPSVTTGVASPVSSTSATLKGTVNPNGLATTIHFEWGTDASYGNGTTAQSVGSGTSSTSVNFGLTGLSPSTLYHFRLVASNSAGPINGPDQVFTTTSGSSGGGSLPTASTTPASSVTSSAATLNGIANPNALATTTTFQWGTTSTYGSNTVPQSIGSGTTGSNVTFDLTGLSPNTLYHYQLVASNSAGVTIGGDVAFTTTSVSTVAVASVFYSFTGLDDGYAPEAALVQGSDGNFYGTSSSGAFYYSGTVFKISPSGSFTILYTFGMPTGAGPEAPLVQGSDGNFYGTTTAGGEGDCEAGCPTIFKISPGGTLTTLYTFTFDYSERPFVTLVPASDGNFYGTTAGGGGVCLYGCGTVFRITPSSDFTTLYNFSIGTDGDAPYTRLVQGVDSNFYGTTTDGGLGGYLSGGGTVYKVSPAGVLSTLHSFTGGLDGAPPGRLLLGSDGNLYGTTASGGAGGSGTIFKMSPTGVLSNLYSFTGGPDGASPDGLLLGSDGNFYGVTSGGGTEGDGTIFKITPAGILSTVFNIEGGLTITGLIQGSDGYFYVTTSNGGTSTNCTDGCGAIYKLYIPPN